MPLRALAALDTAWNKAHLASDAAALDRLWADDIVDLHPQDGADGQGAGAGDVEGRRRDVHPL